MPLVYEEPCLWPVVIRNERPEHTSHDGTRILKPTCVSLASDVSVGKTAAIFWVFSLA